jgi:hypothetical protein
MSRIVALGYITAAAMPPVGLAIGITLTFRRSLPGSRHGPWIIAISIVASVIWALIIDSGALSSTNQSY